MTEREVESLGLTIGALSQWSYKDRNVTLLTLETHIRSYRNVNKETSSPSIDQTDRLIPSLFKIGTPPRRSVTGHSSPKHQAQSSAMPAQEPSSDCQQLS
jgi:hypothetical protein